jgi:PmbA protein
MADRSKVAQYCVKALIESGMDKAESRLLLTAKTELNVEGGSIALMRTTDDVNLFMAGIKDEKRGSTSVNRTDEDSIKRTVSELRELIDASEPDPAVDIAPAQRSESFARGPLEPDRDLMYSRLKSFVESALERYPTLLLEQVILDHTLREKYYSNSNGVAFQSVTGQYNLMVMFTSKEGGNASSFNFVMVSADELDRDLVNYGPIERLIRQSTEQVHTEQLPEAFTGDVILTPECLEDFIGTITDYLGDYPMMTKTSIFKDSLGEKIADSRLTLHSMPLNGEMSGGYFFTPDGFKAQNSTIIDRGVLKTFLLSLYGSRKTGLDKAVNAGSFHVIDPGNDQFDRMVSSIDKGLLLCRFSGGNPASNGDFSGVAKNSYYIENGEIKYPITETMVAGNLKTMLNSVKAISAERVNSGHSILPWITFSGITVSGK